MAVDISPLWIVAGAVLFVLGVRWTLSEAARRNYEQAKAGLPVAKAARQGTFWAAARTAGLVLVLLVALSWFDLLGGQEPGAADPLTWLRSKLPGASTELGSRPRDGNVICFSAECRREHPERPPAK